MMLVKDIVLQILTEGEVVRFHNRPHDQLRSYARQYIDQNYTGEGRQQLHNLVDSYSKRYANYQSPSIGKSAEDMRDDLNMHHLHGFMASFVTDEKDYSEGHPLFDRVEDLAKTHRNNTNDVIQPFYAKEYKSGLDLGVEAFTRLSKYRKRT